MTENQRPARQGAYSKKELIRIIETIDADENQMKYPSAIKSNRPEGHNSCVALGEIKTRVR